MKSTLEFAKRPAGLSTHGRKKNKQIPGLKPELNILVLAQIAMHGRITKLLIILGKTSPP